MRSSLFTLMVFTSLTPLSAYAKDIAVESAVGAAIVYNDRASLTRSAEVEIPAGSHNLVFKGLPLNMYTDSLRTEGSSVANITFGALSHKRESHEDYIVPREKELNDQIVILEDKRKLLEIDSTSVSAGSNFMSNIGNNVLSRVNEDIAEIKLNPESWVAAADTISAKMSNNRKIVHGIKVKTRDIDAKISKLKNELRGLRTGQKQSYSVTIPFESDKPTTLNIDLSYQMPNVGWRPIYDARLDVKSGELELVQYGSVWQRTGEDWNGVELTLSTAQPSRGAGLPDLNPHWISLNNYRAKKDIIIPLKTSNTRMRAPEFGGEKDELSGWRLLQEESAASAPVARKASFRAAQINNEGFVGEYKIVGLSDVKSDGTHAKLLVGAFETENALQVQIKPQLSTEAYLVVKTKLKGDAPILPGQVNLFRDGAYIGKAALPMLRPDDVEELAFGIDDNIRVKRKTLKNETSETGLISKESVIERHFVTDIQNLHKEPIDIAVLETIPVSQDKRLRVEILADKTTAGYEADLHDAKGVTRWIKTLEPKGVAKINLGWKVNWPKDENISGL